VRIVSFDGRLVNENPLKSQDFSGFCICGNSVFLGENCAFYHLNTATYAFKSGLIVSGLRAFAPENAAASVTSNFNVLISAVCVSACVLSAV
jgi:hypothetical protein